jgi:hypothetical protein
MKGFFATLMLAGAACTGSAFAASATLHCTGSGGSAVLLNTVYFNNGVGTGSFLCSDASLGALTLSNVSVSIFNDYTNADGSQGAATPWANSAGFTYTASAGTWAAASAGGNATTMSLNGGPSLTQFTIGNASSQGNSYTNATSGGLGSDGGATSVCPPGGGHACNFTLPTTDAQTVLAGVFTINDTAFVDAGSYSQGATDSHIDVTFTYTPVTTSSPEPVSMLLFGTGLLAVSLIGRKKLVRK